MIKIRQKKQAFRTERRKEYLQNHFSQIRKKAFHLNALNNQHSFLKGTDKLQFFGYLLSRSLQFNVILQQIRERDFLSKLNQLVEECCLYKNLQGKKYLLALITNIFKDELNPFQKEQLFVISFKLFETLNIAFVDFSKPQQLKNYKETIQLFGVDLISFYLAEIISVSSDLQDKEQSLIQGKIYPSFVNLLFYSIQKQSKLSLSQNFITDVQQSFCSIFDLNQQFYETGNRQKVKRNSNFLQSIVVNHFHYLSKNNFFPQNLAKIEAILFWFYHKLADYFENAKELFQKKQLISIIQSSFQYQSAGKKPAVFGHVYSILRTFLDKNIFNSQIEDLMLRFNQETGFFNLDKILWSAQQSKEQAFYVIELIQGILIDFQDNRNFEKLFELYDLRFVQICIRFLQDFQKQKLSVETNRTILRKVLSMMFILIGEGNRNLAKKYNKFILHFDKMNGMSKIEVISSWFEEFDHKQESDVSEICQLIDWILTQNFQFSSEDIF